MVAAPNNDSEYGPMIDEPPLLTIAKTTERPEEELVRRFRDVPTSFICDAMGGQGALDWRIKPISETAMVGIALTCNCGPADILALSVAIARSQPGDVLVAATGGHHGTAVVGDLMLGIAKNRGAAGLVTDGLIRDRVDVQALHLPVFAMGVCPNSPYGHGPGTVGLPVVCGGRTIGSGDIVIGDRDGVVTVPFARIAEVLARLEEVKVAEAAMLKKVKAGLKEVAKAEELLKGPRVKFV